MREPWANGGPMHNLPCSATVTIPANALIVLTVGGGDPG